MKVKEVERCEGLVVDTHTHTRRRVRVVRT